MKDALTNTQIDQFIHHGYVHIEDAFSETIGKQCRDILWKDLGLDAHQPETWIQPVVRLGMYTQPSFIEAANTRVLHGAFNQLIGENRWIPCTSMGTFPIRFPSPQDPGDTGWHVDASFPGNDPQNYFEWRINYKSKGRALLMLFLFSDVGPQDAPTRLRIGSHIDIARILEQEGDRGLSFMEIASKLPTLPERPETLATGLAGTVYLCHPFMAHSAQPHAGTVPRFMAQPPLLLRDALTLTGHSDQTPLEKSIALALK